MLRPGAGIGLVRRIEQRWLNWAQRLCVSHARFAGRHHPANLTLVHPFLFLQVLRERILLRASYFSPQVNLTLQTVIRWDESKQSGEFRRGPVLKQFNFSTPMSFSHSINQTFAQNPNVLRASSFRVANWKKDVANPGILWPLTFTAATGVGGEATHGLLPLMLQQISRKDEYGHSRIETNVNVHGITTLLKRLAEQTNRIEHRLAAPSPLVARRTSTVDASVALRRPTSSTAGDTVSNAAGSEHFAEGQLSRTMPAVNIEQLTDQVMRQLDRRIVAARERMGKI